jgi:hypothetical protein
MMASAFFMFSRIKSANLFGNTSRIRDDAAAVLTFGKNLNRCVACDEGFRGFSVDEPSRLVVDIDEQFARPSAIRECHDAGVSVD